MTKHLVKVVAVVAILASVSCKKDAAPNYQLFPNMYQSVGYETYSESEVFNNGIEAQTPVEGTIKRGWMPYGIEDTVEGKAFAKEHLKSPIEATQENLATGKELYGIYCAVCHGKSGKGDGNLVKREKFLGVPSYADRDINTGSTYHTIYYGLNSMGSHAGQLNENERWQVALYVTNLKTALTK